MPLPLTEDSYQRPQALVLDPSIPEAVQTHPFFQTLRDQYEALPSDRVKSVLKPEFTVVANKITVEQLNQAMKLERPTVFGINEVGELILGEVFTTKKEEGDKYPKLLLNGDLEKAQKRMGMNYFVSRRKAMEDGFALLTEAEFKAFGELMKIGGYSQWLESGELSEERRNGGPQPAPVTALIGYFHEDKIKTARMVPNIGDDHFYTPIFRIQVVN